MILISLGNNRTKTACCGRRGPKSEWIENFFSERITSKPDLVMLFEGSNPNWIKNMQVKVSKIMCLLLQRNRFLKDLLKLIFHKVNDGNYCNSNNYF